MLTELVVEGLGVIDRAELQPGPGSSALTGETGAGKTLLVAALGLLLGARSDKGLVRQGRTSASVDAVFELPANHPITELLAENDLADPTSDRLLLSRTVSSDGKSKGRINGRPVTLSLLQEVGRGLIEIAGQNEHHELNSAAAQRALLDHFAGEETRTLADRVADAVDRLTQLSARLETLRATERDRARELDVLSYEIREIENANLRDGELDELMDAVRRLEHADQIAAGVGGAGHRLKGEGGVGELLAGAIHDLETIAEMDPAMPDLLERLKQAAIEVADVADELGHAAVRSDPSALAEGRERIAQLSRLLKKYGPSESDVIAYVERSRVRAEALHGAGDEEEGLLREIETVKAEAMQVATALSSERRAGADRLSKEMERVLSHLALGDARFVVELTPRELYRGGLEAVGFLVSANAGEAARPIAKVASGGELSRIALALRLLSNTGSATTLVFDEVDAGVGGEAARSVGQHLAELGKREGTQVLVVTHLPQVAAFADNQYRVAKTTDGGRTASMVELVEASDRVEELSRMLAGLPESERAREHAQELLEIAGQGAGGR